MTTDWSHYPKSDPPTELMTSVVAVFEAVRKEISSKTSKLGSNEVLAHVQPGLAELGFHVETGKKKREKVFVPVLFGHDGAVEKAFEADAYHREAAFVLEVEAGGAVANHKFLKDLFQACVMLDVDYLGIAVRVLYEGGGRTSPDYKRVLTFFDTLYSSQRLKLPLKGVLIVGY